MATTTAANIDSWTVVGGKITNEVSEERLDEMIVRNTTIISNVDIQITNLNKRKTDAQTRLAKLNAIKTQLPSGLPKP